MRPLIVLVHGIRTDEEAASWQERMRFWLAQHRPDVDVLTWEYLEGAFPAWNVFVQNPREAHRLAAELLPYAQSGPQISFIAHSNGCDIALKTIEFLDAQGHETAAAVLMAAVLPSDVDRSGILELVERGVLGKAFAYWSPNDQVLALPLIWPYGHLGHVGFTREGASFSSPDLVNHIFPGFDHCDYFAPAHQDSIFERAAADAFPVPNKPNPPK